MGQTILVENEYTSEDYTRAKRYLEKQVLLIHYLVVLSPVFVLLFLNLFIFSLSNSYDETNYFAIAIINLIVLFLVAGVILLLNRFYPFLVNLSFKKHIRSSPSLWGKTSIKFSVEGVENTNELGSTMVKWNAFIKATESESDIFLFTSPKTAFFYPKSIFSSKESLVDLRNLINANLGDKSNL